MVYCRYFNNVIWSNNSTSITTYAEKDYDYIINDCKPSVVFVSNDEQYKKIENIIKSKNFIKKVFLSTN